MTQRFYAFWLPLVLLAASLCLGAGVARAQQSAPASSVPAQPIDSIVALVNDAVITRNQLDHRVDETVRQLKLQNRPVPDHDQLERQVLEQMIVIQAQLQRAKEDGIVVKDADVEQAIQRVAADNKMTVDQYRQKLASSGVSWSDFRNEVRNQMTIARVRDKEVDSQIQVSQSEIDNYLTNHRGADASPAQTEYHVAQILVAVPDNASADQVAQAQHKADDVLQQAQRPGADFAALAQQDSDDHDTAAKGGDMGYRIPERLPDLFLNAIEKLKPGQVVPQVLRSPNGFHIVKLLDVRQTGGSSGMVVPQIHARHILIRVGDGVSEAEARRRLLDIKAKIQSGQADFADMARRYSADGSAAQGGDLGWISPGETVPAFERAMSQLQDGQISDPVRTEYGYHLIQVLGHREEQVSGEQERNLAMQALRASKADQAYQDWLAQLIAGTFIERRLPSSTSAQQ